jgi:predicted acylesterase/phospholipase RssA
LDRVRDLPRPLAFVLPGGGALGAYQVGVLRALAEHDVVADLLVGVSAGAVNAALAAWHPGVDGTSHLEHVWRSIRRRDLLRVHPGRLALAFTGQRPSFLDSRTPQEWVRRTFGHRQLEDAPTRVAIIATDVITGRAVALSSGEVASAVMASCAFPAVYPPIQREGRLLMDGGVVADIPLDLTIELGAASAIVLSVPPLAAGMPRMRAIDLLFRASTFGVEAHGRSVLARPPDGLVVLEIDAPPSLVTTFAVGTAAGIIGESYANAMQWLSGGAVPADGVQHRG